MTINSTSKFACAAAISAWAHFNSINAYGTFHGSCNIGYVDPKKLLKANGSVAAFVAFDFDFDHLSNMGSCDEAKTECTCPNIDHKDDVLCLWPCHKAFPNQVSDILA